MATLRMTEKSMGVGCIPTYPTCIWHREVAEIGDSFDSRGTGVIFTEKRVTGTKIRRWYLMSRETGLTLISAIHVARSKHM